MAIAAPFSERGAFGCPKLHLYTPSASLAAVPINTVRQQQMTTAEVATPAATNVLAQEGRAGRAFPAALYISKMQTRKIPDIRRTFFFPPQRVQAAPSPRPCSERLWRLLERPLAVLSWCEDALRHRTLSPPGWPVFGFRNEHAWIL